jgi:hypothetical protein
VGGGSSAGERRARALLAGGSVLLVLVVAEGVLREFPTWFIYASMRNVVQRDCTRPDPRVGYVNKEDYSGVFSNREFRTRVEINGDGFRDRPYPREPSPGRVRCVALGDSFVFGWGVEAEESVAKLLEARLAPAEVMNAGCSGWSTKQEVLFLGERILDYHPDVVFLFFCENDPVENVFEYAFVDGHLAYAGEKRGWGASTGRFLARHSALFNLVREAFGSPLEGWHAGEGTGSLWDLEEGYLRRFGALCTSHGARAVVVYVPHKNRRGLPRHGSYFSDLEAFCRKEGLPLVDLVPAMESERQPVFFRYDDHWNRHGHELAARVLARFVKDSGWLDPTPGATAP